MSITFQLTATDFARLQKSSNRRLNAKIGWLSPVLPLRIVFWFCISLAGFSYARLMREYPELSVPLQIIAWLLVGAIVVVVLMPLLSQVVVRKYMLLPDGAFLSPQSLELTDGGFILTSTAGRSEIPWSAVRGKQQDDRNHYLYLDALQAVVLPKVAVSPIREALEHKLSQVRD